MPIGRRRSDVRPVFGDDALGLRGIPPPAAQADVRDGRRPSGPARFQRTGTIKGTGAYSGKYRQEMSPASSRLTQDLHLPSFYRRTARGEAMLPHLERFLALISLPKELPQDRGQIGVRRGDRGDVELLDQHR